MKNNVCKKCGIKFHACSSCEISYCWQYDYCNTNCLPYPACIECGELDCTCQQEAFSKVANAIADLAVEMDREEYDDNVSRDRYHALIEIGSWFEKDGKFEIKDGD